MKDIDNKTMTESDWAELLNQPVPDSSTLQQRIIAQARELPQFQNLPKQTSYWARFVRSFNVALHPGLKPLAIGCVAAIVGVVLVKAPEFSEMQLAENGNDIVIDTTVENVAIMDQASWDELMLMQDELAFADFL